MEDWFIDFLTGYEGFKANPYKDNDGNYVIGYGTKELADGTPVTANTKPITKEQGRAALLSHLDKQISVLGKYFPDYKKYPTQVKYGLLNMGYRGGPDVFAISPAFTKALIEGWADGKLTDAEKRVIAKEMNTKETGNLGNRNNRMMAMLFNDYNPKDNNTVGYYGDIPSRYDEYYLQWVNSKKSGGKLNYLNLFN